MAISDYSTTAASNTSISGISLAENVMVPSDVNNAIRQMMADIKAGVPYLSGSNYLIESTDAGASAGPVFELYRNSASPAASDILGKVLFNGEDSAGNTQEYASVETVIVDATSTSEDGQLDFYVTKAGARTKFISVVGNSDWVDVPRGQVKFPATQNASSDPNVLDDYEEGTFTPALTFGGGSTGLTYGSRAGAFTKAGNLVTFNINITLSAKGSSTGNASVSGLPFAPAAETAVTIYPAGGGVFASLTAGMIGVIAAAGTAVTLRAPNTTGSAAVSDGNMTNTSQFTISGSYLV